jgi:hypothetical protein
VARSAEIAVAVSSARMIEAIEVRIEFSGRTSAPVRLLYSVEGVTVRCRAVSRQASSACPEGFSFNDLLGFAAY